MGPKLPLKTRYGGPKPKPKPTPKPPLGGVDFVMVPPQGDQPSAQPQSLRAPEPQPPAPVPALAPVDSGAPQGAQPFAQPLRAPEPQPPAHVPAPWRRLTWVCHRVLNPHYNHCVPLSHNRPPLSRPWRRLTRVRHRVVNPHHNQPWCAFETQCCSGQIVPMF